MIPRIDSSERPHPLFDPTSLYRTASRGTIWAGDRGAGSIQRFFLDLLRDWYLKQDPMKPPEDVPRGVFPDHVYELHYQEWRQQVEREAKAQKQRRSARRLAAGSGYGLAPRVCRFDVSGRSRGPGQLVTDESIRFSGQNEYDRRGELPSLTSFSIWSEKPITPRCRWLMLLVGPDLIGALAKALGRPARPEWTDEEALEVMNAATDCLSPGGEGQAAAQQGKAFNVAILLALAHGLEGETDKAGKFKVLPITLQPKCPVPPTEYRLAVFEGPALPDLPEVPS